ncbi:MAG: hypothetical protein ACM3UL_00610 [Ignavibacteria bacterium]
MNRLKKIYLSSFFTLLVIATLAIMASSATASSMTNAGTASQEKMVIPNVQFIAGTGGGNDTINLTVANLSPRSATIMGCILKDENGNKIILFEIKPSQPIIEKSSFDQISLTVKPNTLVNGRYYTLTVVTASGGSFVSYAFDTSSSAEYDPLKDEKLQADLQSSLRATPVPQATSTPVCLNVVLIGSTIVAAVSILGAYKLSEHIIGSENRKDRYILFIFISVIFVSFILSAAFAIWFTSGTLAAA